MPPSLSSIQWLGAFSRFMCFLGPRTIVAPAAGGTGGEREGAAGARRQRRPRLRCVVCARPDAARPDGRGARGARGRRAGGRRRRRRRAPHTARGLCTPRRAARAGPPARLRRAQTGSHAPRPGRARPHGPAAADGAAASGEAGASASPRRRLTLGNHRDAPRRGPRAPRPWRASASAIWPPPRRAPRPSPAQDFPGAGRRKRTGPVAGRGLCAGPIGAAGGATVARSPPLAPLARASRSTGCYGTSRGREVGVGRGRLGWGGGVLGGGVGGGAAPAVPMGAPPAASAPTPAHAGEGVRGFTLCLCRSHVHGGSPRRRAERARRGGGAGGSGRRAGRGSGAGTEGAGALEVAGVGGRAGFKLAWGGRPVGQCCGWLPVLPRDCVVAAKARPPEGRAAGRGMPRRVVWLQLSSRGLVAMHGPAARAGGVCAGGRGRPAEGRRPTRLGGGAATGGRAGLPGRGM
jgi:hypothetical protein